MQYYQHISIIIEQAGQCVHYIIRNLHCVTVNLLQELLLLIFFNLQVFVINVYFSQTYVINVYIIFVKYVFTNLYKIKSDTKVYRYFISIEQGMVCTK